jgi:hypothetical protein
LAVDYVIVVVTLEVNILVEDLPTMTLKITPAYNLQMKAFDPKTMFQWIFRVERAVFAI